MSVLAEVRRAMEQFDRSVEREVTRARSDQKVARDLLKRWRETSKKIETTTTPTGIPLPRFALPATGEPGEIARYLYSQGLPGQFPFVNSVYPSMYLDAD